MLATCVELTSVSAFVRQHTHDLRNHLTGLDLEAAVVGELITDPALGARVDRLRGQIRAIAAELKTLAGKFGAPEASRAPIAASVLFLVWQDQAAALGLDWIEWGTTLGEETIALDVGEVCDVLQELLVNAKQFNGTGGLAAMADARGGRVTFELRESKRETLDPSEWGGKPFVSTKRGGYGLGLWHAQQTIAANGGEIVRTFLPKGTLVTKVAFPQA